jgi:hypothetical protein
LAYSPAWSAERDTAVQAIERVLHLDPEIVAQGDAHVHATGRGKLANLRAAHPASGGG